MAKLFLIALCFQLASVCAFSCDKETEIIGTPVTSPSRVSNPYPNRNFGKPLSRRQNWRKFKSGWRVFSETASRAYGTRYKKWVGRAKKPAHFEDFMDLLQLGVSQANRAAREADPNTPFQGSYGWEKKEGKMGPTHADFDREKIWSRDVNEETYNDFAKFVGIDPTYSYEDGAPREASKSRDVHIQLGSRKISTMRITVNYELVPTAEGVMKSVVKKVHVDYLLTSEEVGEVFAHLKELYQIAIGADDAAACRASFEMADLIRKAVPYVQGSGGVADALSIALLEPRGFKFGEVRPGIGLDLKSWTRENLDQTIEEYPSYFVQP